MFPISDDRPSGHFPIITLILIFTSIAAFIAELLSPNMEALISKYSLIATQLDFSNYKTFYPFITSIFLHGGFVHIISNLWFLWIFGDNVEGAFGPFKFLLFYLGSGIVASFAQLAFLAGLDIPMLGASGAIAGVLGAYYRLFPKHKIKTLIPVFGIPAIISVPASFMLIYWFITQIFSGVASIGISSTNLGGVAFWAHVGGFVFGLVVGPLLAKLWRI